VRGEINTALILLRCLREMGVQRGLIAQVIVRGMMEGGAKMEEVMGMIQQLRELGFKQVRGDVEGEERWRLYAFTLTDEHCYAHIPCNVGICAISRPC